ncbi:thermonuclease family protein [Desulfovibrio sp. JC022]|uniref:thermonuclease family protein n=1 Tax=Desulfovibrio sp. JC022 TaxID=2593642 RepID=UPI0013D10093|nr:thermonuclease family protein [Desulfovibrio sp. JC022]NDV24640.1 thermonuclease family protein [Desulfovibrio sp. JC022]
MKKALIFFLTAFVILIASVYYARAEQFQYLRPKDGDSFSVMLRGLDIDIRLISVDCPEYKQEFGQEAREFTDQWLRKGSAYIEYDHRTQDRYKRVLGYVWRKGEMLNYELVRRGYCIVAYYADTQMHYPELKEAEELAKKDRIGIWANGGLEMTPAEFRKWKRRRKVSVRSALKK